MQISSAALLKEAKAFHAKKHLGQHFLVDPEALQCVVASLAGTASDTIIEVGPGIGFLTRLLSETGARTIAVDLDRESVERLEQMHLPNVEVRHGDFLHFDLNTLQFTGKNKAAGAVAIDSNSRLRVVGNVPYQITGLIIGHLLGEIDRPSAWLHRIDGIVLTVQREVALRMVAHPGTPDYSKVSLLIANHCESSLEMIVPPESFYPPPAVTSAIVKLKPRKQMAVQVSNPLLLRQIIEAGFRQRRKMLRNGLSFLRLPNSDIDAIFRQLSLDPLTRAERLSLAQFAMLADAIDKHLKTHADDQGTGPGES